MLRSGSLKTRVFLLTIVPLGLLLVTLFAVSHRTASRTIHENVRQSLVAAGSVFVEQLATQQRGLLTMARVTAEDPRFFVTLSIPEEERGDEFVPTLEGVADEFLRITDADFLDVFDARGHVLTSVDRERGAGASLVARGSIHGRDGVDEALRGTLVQDVYAAGPDLMVAAVVPVFVAGELEAALRVGLRLDRGFALEVRRLTDAELALGHGARVFASSYPALETSPTEPWADSARCSHRPPRPPFGVAEPFTAHRDGVEYLLLQVTLHGSQRDTCFQATLGRPLQAELLPLQQLDRRMASIGVIALALALVGAYLVALSVTRPLSRILQAASALQQGDFDAALDVRGRDEVAGLARSFAAMRDSLQKHVEHLHDLDQMKSDFIALAGHELKTPLTIITGFSDLIASGDLGDVPPDVRETSEIIRRQLFGLNELVENILDISRFEQGLNELSREEIDLRPLVATTVEQHADKRHGRDVEVQLDLPEEAPRLMGDEQRLGQVLILLLDNAVRYTPDGGRVVVSVEHDDEWLRMRVRDTGVGIPAHEIEWIFDKCYEVGDINRHSSGRLEFGSRGFGLGLALVRAIVKQHQGTVDVRSAPGRGSEFTVALRHVGACKPALQLV